jgi:asparagine synthase (glutamine-hydrolysing)
VREAAVRGAADPFTGSDDEAADALDARLRDAVAHQMVADVPLGAFLSGGVDSSTIVALMQAQSATPVRTFSIGFHESGYNEAEHAKAVASHLRTDHTELYVDSGDALAVIPRLPEMYDEPFADSSQIPTFLVARMARRDVTVSLSGDGGDELFGGYNRYFVGRRVWNRMRGIPTPLRRALAAGLGAVPPRRWDALNQLLPARFRQPQVGNRLRKLGQVLEAGRPEAIYERLVSEWTSPNDVVRGGREPLTDVTDPARRAPRDDFTERMMYLDSVTYLPDDILAKVDRAAMAVSLETRVPFLDHRVVELAWRIPIGMKVRGGEGKWLLRQVLYRYVPRELIERPKMGFGIPVNQWLRGPLRDWAEALLDERRLREEGYFDPAPIRARWREHLAGTADWQYSLWGILMFQAWLEHAERPSRVRAHAPLAAAAGY